MQDMIFANVEANATFCSEDMVLIKKLGTSFHNGNLKPVDYNAINLDTGDAYYFEDNDMVLVLDTIK